MKPIIFLFTALFAFSVHANDEKYISTMTKQIEAVYKAQTVEEFQAAINTFERIGNAEKTKWEPFYYASFGYIMMAVRADEASKKDSYLDRAKAVLDKANAILPNDSEILALEGFIHMIRVTVDPPARGQQFSMMAMQAFGKAVGTNPNNPRALSLMAQMQLGTAQFFNQPPTEACETGKKALALFNNPTPSENPLAPRWGKSMAEGMLKSCQ